MPFYLPSFDQRDDFEGPAFSVAGASSTDGAGADHLSQTSDQHRENFQSASVSLAQVLRRERREIQRMQINDENAATEFWRKDKEKDYQIKAGLIFAGEEERATIAARREKMTVYLKERESQRMKASANLDKIEKHVAGTVKSATHYNHELSNNLCTPRGGLKANGLSADGFAALPLTPPGTKAAQASGTPTREEAGAEELMEARIAQYESMNVTGRIALLRKRLVSDNQMPDDLVGREPGAGDPTAVRQWNAQVRARNAQISRKVDGFQDLMRGKLERIASHADCPLPSLKKTGDPAAAVRDAVLKYHQQCLELDSYYVTGRDDMGSEAMSVEQRCEIEDAVAALGLQDSVMDSSKSPPPPTGGATEGSTRRIRFVAANSMSSVASNASI